MLTLQEIFDDLASGALSNLSVVDQLTQKIKVSAYPKVLSYVNLSLTAVHKRFLLRTGEVVVQLYPHMNRYALRSAFAVNNAQSNEPIRYIIDTPDDPFKDDIIKIERVYSELHEEFPINDSEQLYPIYTPEFDVISALPTSWGPQAIWVVYRAKYPKILITDDFNPALIQVTIPDFILDALYSRIGAYAYKGITGEEGETSASRSYMFQYELECKRLETENVTVDDNSQPFNVFGDRGWV